jgi:hypothetical protein
MFDLHANPIETDALCIDVGNDCIEHKLPFTHITPPPVKAGEHASRAGLGGCIDSSIPQWLDMNHAITNQSEKEKQLKENMEQLKATQKKVYRQMEQLRGQERQRHHHNRQIVQVAILVGCRTSGNMKAVKVFLQKNWRKFAEDEDAAIDSALERVRLDCSSMTLTAAVGLLQEFDVGKKKRMGEKAKRFCKEYKLSQWVEEVNLSQGVTPYTQNVILEARNLGMIVADKQTKYKNQKQLLRRWRRRWNISLGSIACREGVLAHVAQAKAAGECFFWVRERNVAYRRYETGPIW